ncbi:hypothetical protein [Paraburkholderia unamae]|uniref:Uncharacterized protein n=1 Tax=Paraburkholderia unamae TaxID=219649 RepID=A0ACC6RP39_9BURK
MQIGAATQFANGSANTNTLRAGAASDEAEQEGAQSGDVSTTVAPSTSQDDAVQISPQGYAVASTNDTADSDDAAADASDAAGTSDTSDATDTSDASGATATSTNAQPMKSLVYGALGLERPDAPADPNHTYTLGRWIAAGITLGGIISLFI